MLCLSQAGPYLQNLGSCLGFGDGGARQGDMRGLPDLSTALRVQALASQADPHVKKWRSSLGLWQGDMAEFSDLRWKQSKSDCARDVQMSAQSRRFVVGVDSVYG